MKKLEDFIAEGRSGSIQLSIDPIRLRQLTAATDEGLFQVPLLCICILVIAKFRPKGLATAELAVWIGSTLGKYFSAPPSSYRKIEWSLDYRKRCAEALVFLEASGLASVEMQTERRATCTSEGLDFLLKASRREDEIGFLVRGLTRSYRTVENQGMENVWR